MFGIIRGVPACILTPSADGDLSLRNVEFLRSGLWIVVAFLRNSSAIECPVALDLMSSECGSTAWL